MPEKQQQRYYELFTMCWKILRRGLREMTTTSDPAKLADDLRAEGLVLLGEYRDLHPEAVLGIIDNTLKLFYKAYEDLPRPEREPEQMDIFSIGKEAKN